MLYAHGRVLDVEHREGIVKAGERTGQPWEMDTVSLLVGKARILQLTLGKDVPVPAEGDSVTYRVFGQPYRNSVQYTAAEVVDPLVVLGLADDATGELAPVVNL